jgi:hypothetical protein
LAVHATHPIAGLHFDVPPVHVCDVLEGTHLWFVHAAAGTKTVLEMLTPH